MQSRPLCLVFIPQDQYHPISLNLGSYLPPPPSVAVDCVDADCVPVRVAVWSGGTIQGSPNSYEKTTKNTRVSNTQQQKAYLTVQ
jgi:hypothetical protein